MAASPEQRILDKWEPVIGLEVHAQLATRTKMFCRCSWSYGAAPNTQTCPVCLGYPGSLPVLNEAAVHLAIKIGLAVGCEIRLQSRFARKNYFYPDLSKGYQISQYDEPLCSGGRLSFYLEDGSRKSVGITRIHMEEDSGKSLHGLTFEESHVDFNRCGAPLVEIVSEPDIRTPEEARRYLLRLKQTLEYTGVSAADMEKGNLRCDANISVRPRGSEDYGTRTEMKNLNSFRGVERGLAYEIRRQIALLERGEEIEQCTLQWDEASGTTRVLRTKEEAHDYRYFPEPDLPPLAVSEENVAAIRKTLPELPAVLEERFTQDYGLRFQDVEILTRSSELAYYFESLVSEIESPDDAARWVLGEVLRVIKDERISIAEFKLSPARLGELAKLTMAGTVNANTAKTVFEKMYREGLSAGEIVERDRLVQVSDSSAIEGEIRKVLADSSAEVERFQNGEEKLFGYFMGQVMKATRGKGDPGMVRSILRRLLNE